MLRKTKIEHRTQDFLWVLFFSISEHWTCFSLGLEEFGGYSKLWPLSVLLIPCMPVAALASSSTAASPEHLHLIPALPGDSDSQKQQPLPVSDGEGRRDELMFVKLLADDSAVVWYYTHIIAGCRLIARHGINF